MGRWGENTKTVGKLQDILMYVFVCVFVDVTFLILNIPYLYMFIGTAVAQEMYATILYAHRRALSYHCSMLVLITNHCISHALAGQSLGWIPRKYSCAGDYFYSYIDVTEHNNSSTELSNLWSVRHVMLHGAPARQ